MSPPRLSTIAWKHLALITSLAVIALAVIRVLFFSGMSVPVGLAVLNVADRASVLSSTLLLVAVAFVPLVLAYAPARAWLWAGNASGATLWMMLRTAVLWIPMSLFIIGVAPIGVIAGLFLGAVLGELLRRWGRRSIAKGESSRKRVQGAVSSVGWVWATLTGILLAAILQQPWMPIERMELTDSDEEFVGYVVGQQEGYILLLDRAKTPLWIPSGVLESRQVCNAGSESWFFMTAFDLVKDASGLSLPRCPAREP